MGGAKRQELFTNERYQQTWRKFTKKSLKVISISATVDGSDASEKTRGVIRNRIEDTAIFIEMDRDKTEYISKGNCRKSERGDSEPVCAHTKGATQDTC